MARPNLAAMRTGILAGAVAVALISCSSPPLAASAPGGKPAAGRPSPTAGAAQPMLSPLAIDAMRQRDYPGSDLAIERTLAAGSNYRQYVASYQSDGLKINSLLTVPNGPKPPTGWPVIVFNHGYISPTVYRTTERYVAYVDAFARNGYIVFKPDYRGFGSSQGQPVSAYYSPDDTVDVLIFFQAEDGIRDLIVTGVQTCALPIYPRARTRGGFRSAGRRLQRPPAPT